MDFHKVNKLWNYLKTCLELIKFCEFGGKKLATKLAADEIKKKSYFMQKCSNGTTEQLVREDKLF